MRLTYPGKTLIGLINQIAKSLRKSNEGRCEADPFDTQDAHAQHGNVQACLPSRGLSGDRERRFPRRGYSR